MDTGQPQIEDNQLDILENPKVWLLGKLMERKYRNPAYSLRAFSTSVGCSPATLSQIFSGKRTLTKKMTKKIAQKLGLSPQEQFLLLSKIKEEAPYQPEKNTPEELDIDIFKLISHWHSYAILSLAELTKNEASPLWVSQRLGILEAEAARTYSQLKALGLIQERDRRFFPGHKPLTVWKTKPEGAIRKFHDEILQKAKASQEQDPYDSRDFGCMTMAINPSKLAAAGEKIRRFRVQMAKFLESGGERTRVYVLSTQLFPLDKNQSQKEVS